MWRIEEREVRREVSAVDVFENPALPAGPTPREEWLWRLRLRLGARLQLVSAHDELEEFFLAPLV